MFHKMPFILLGVIIFVALLNPYIPPSAQSLFYALGLSIKSVILFLLPFVIFGLLFKTAGQLAKSATKIILFLLIAICCSNFLSTMISYNIGMVVHHFDLSIAVPQESLGLQPAWIFSLPKWISNAHAMFAGLVLGVGVSLLIPKVSQKLALGCVKAPGVEIPASGSYVLNIDPLAGTQPRGFDAAQGQLLKHFRYKWKAAEKFSLFLEKGVNGILRGFILAMPLFIAGFAMKLIHDGVIIQIVKDYALIFALIAAAVFGYIALIYLFANRFHLKSFINSIKNMLPAAITGFGSMSSAAAMPLTIIGAEKNSSHPSIARAVIPATVNIHLIGDCFAIPIFAFAVMKNFGFDQPELWAYLTFAFYFVMAKFSVAAIPGGGIIVMLPILESCLGFNAEMMSLITALYILFDPVITCANVFGNGGFSMVFSKVFGKMNRGSSVFLEKSTN